MGQEAEKAPAVYTYLVCYTFFKDRPARGDIRLFGYDFVTSDVSINSSVMVEAAATYLAAKIGRNIIITSICSLNTETDGKESFVYLISYTGTSNRGDSLSLGYRIITMDKPFSNQGEIYALIHEMSQKDGQTIIPTSLQLL